MGTTHYRQFYIRKTCLLYLIQKKRKEVLVEFEIDKVGNLSRSGIKLSHADVDLVEVNKKASSMILRIMEL